MSRKQQLPGAAPWLFWPALFFAGVAVSLPFAIVQYLPLNDYPFHLARSLIIVGDDSSSLGKFYDEGSWLLPNLAQDIFVQLASMAFSAEQSVKLFVWSIVCIQFSGAVFLHYVAHRRYSMWPFVTSVVIFNGILVYGFVNFLFGVGIALFGIALWLQFRERRWMIPLAGLISCILILCHLEAMGVFALAVGAIELEHAWRLWRGRDGEEVSLTKVIKRLGLASLPFVVPALMFLLLSPTSSDLEQGFGYYGYLPGKLVFGPLFSLSTRMTEVDLVLALALAGIVLWALVTRRLRVHPPLLWSAIALGLAALVLPKYAMGSDFVDVRLVPVAAVLLLVAIDIGPSRSTDRQFSGVPRMAYGLVLLVLALVVIRSGGVMLNWLAWDRVIGTIVDDYESIEPGAIVYAAIVGPSTQLIPNSAETRAAWRPPLKHVASYAVMAAPVFVPMTFVDPNKQPLRIADRYQPVKDLQTHNPFRVDRPTELATLVERLGRFSSEADLPIGQSVYLSVIGSHGEINWDTVAGSELAARSPRHMLLRLQINRGVH